MINFKYFNFVVLGIFVLIFFMQSFLYLQGDFINNYAIKDMLIKWTNGELVRRGALGSILYYLEPLISIRYSAPFTIFICLICSLYIVTSKLTKINLPNILIFTIILSPSLFLFNLHDTLVLRKDLTCVFGTLVILLVTESSFANINVLDNLEIKRRLTVFVLSYLYLFITFVLVFELFVIFLPIISLYVFINFLRLYNFRDSLKYSLAISFLSLVLFVLVTLPYSGDEHVVASIVNDWREFYPTLVVFGESLESLNGPVDPLAFMMMSHQHYKEWYIALSQNTSLLELVLCYILGASIFIILYVFKFIKLNESITNNINKKLFFFILLLAIHTPLLLSIVAFDFGRWITFTMYSYLIAICFFMVRNEKQKVFSFFDQKATKIGLYFICIVYILSYKPLHWVTGGTILEFNEYEIFYKLIKFYPALFNYYFS